MSLGLTLVASSSCRMVVATTMGHLLHGRHFAHTIRNSYNYNSKQPISDSYYYALQSVVNTLHHYLILKITSMRGIINPDSQTATEVHRP